MPPAIPVWVDALKNVDRAPTRVMSRGSTAIGFRFPDPRFLANTKNTAMYTACWLAARGYHMWTLSNGQQNPSPVSSQQWRDFMASIKALFGPEFFNQMDVSGEVQTGADVPTLASAVVGKKKNKHKRKHVEHVILAEHPLCSQRPDKVFWHEQAIQLGSEDELNNQLTPEITGEVIWELYELNFRFELLTLDRVAAAGMWCPMGSMNLQEAMALRDLMVRKVFPLERGMVGNYVLAKFPTRDEGLAASKWQDRMPHVLALRHLMYSWKGCPFSIKAASTYMDESRLLKLEEELVNFYSQSFFDHFGRAPITPHRLPRRARS
jgi:hypothetical protein